jgi:hypothetical protein
MIDEQRIERISGWLPSADPENGGRHRSVRFEKTEVLPAVDRATPTPAADPALDRDVWPLTAAAALELAADADVPGEWLDPVVEEVEAERGFTAWVYRNLTFPRLAVLCLVAGVLVGTGIGWWLA